MTMPPETQDTWTDRQPIEAAAVPAAPPAPGAGPHATGLRPADPSPTDLPATNPQPTDLQRTDPGAGAPALSSRAHREREGRWVAGVATGVANHLGWPVWLVRGVFVALSLWQFLGVFVYGLLWVVLPARKDEEEAPGLVSAERTGKRVRPRGTPAEFGAVSALAAIAVGGAMLAQRFGHGLPSQWFWPMAFAAAGLALVWRQADDPTEVPPGTHRLMAPFVTKGGWLAMARVALGLGMVGTAISIVAASQIGLDQLPALLLLNVFSVGGLVLVAAPWLYRMRRRIAEAHEEKLLADARADMAAHLHDSVLQTLALIQRQSDDPRAVASLARRQERELRGWLYGGGSDETHLKAALVRAAQEVEDERGVPVEVVCVGDVELTPNLQALVAATREAIMNAAKHADAPSIDVFAEVEDEAVEIFVRDRGRGFDLAEIADDRQGVRNSIIARMERHGGTARIRSAPGEGTDIRLEMNR
ncbi:ATP-binding protein [Aestuariimicrobium ganziense]|uniref:ATP-binding protein n=1 Tax=Aestuariimicrobium ganziense TaxID=2773677 RepID=UPI0019405536|nr:ATP-binding protein [Aestuariimicrobium ganziense]